MTVSVVLCTAPTDESRSLVDRLLEERLIACANMIGPMVSRYRWRGAIEEGRETLLLMKTRQDLVPMLRSRIEELHSYDVPEVLELGVDSGAAAYLAWVGSECRPAGAD